jgi:hypothetical protein
MSKRIILLIVCLAALAVGASAQSSAQKSWPAFWNSFKRAVVSQNLAGVKALMAPEKDFFSGGGGETRDEWLRMIKTEGNWPLFVRSVRGGTKPYIYDGVQTARITTDNTFIFVFMRGRWRFVGPMGD